MTFEKQLAELCDKHSFSCTQSFPEGWVKFYWEDGVIRYMDDCLAISLYRFVREYRDVDLDFFEWYHIPPLEVREIMDTYLNNSLAYDECAAFLEDIEAVGWTFSFGLDGEPYDLRPIL